MVCFMLCIEPEVFRNTRQTCFSKYDMHAAAANGPEFGHPPSHPLSVRRAVSRALCFRVLWTLGLESPPLGLASDR